MLVMSEPGFHPTLSAEERTEVMRQHRIRLAMLPPDRFPRAGGGGRADDRLRDRSFTTGSGSTCSSAGVAALAERGGDPA